MKKLILPALLIFFTTSVEAQNVGIGTLTPHYKLHVAGGDLFFATSGGFLRLGADGGNQWLFNTALSGADLLMLSNNGTTITQRLQFKQNGNVGIGTSAVDARLTIQGAGSTSATNALLIKNSATDSILRLLDNGNLGIGFPPAAIGARLNLAQDGSSATSVLGFYNNSTYAGGIKATDSTLEINPKYGVAIGASPGDLILIPPAGLASFAGNVGIGTNNPVGKLSLKTTGTAAAATPLIVYNGNDDTLMRMNAVGNVGYKMNASSSAARLSINQDASATLGTSFYNNSSYAGSIKATDSTLELFTRTGSLLTAPADLILMPPPALFATSGNIGIGVNAPTAKLHIAGTVVIGNSASTPATGYKLSIEGNAMCEELKVQLHGNWPDYVFTPEYSLMPLSQLEQSILQNKHLPNIPSAADVNSANGFMVGELNRRLLEKVEELTLYLIEADKKIESLQHRLNAIEQQSHSSATLHQ